VQAIASTDAKGAAVTLTGMPDAGTPLIAPLSVLFNVLSVSRGQTISAETLGSGDAGTAGQEFVLQKSPLTYLASSDSTSGEGYKSTLRVFVNGVAWQEVPSFFDQPPAAAIFVTREDESNKTHVQFGDGVNGARLPSGTGNVIATYRIGSGADHPDSGSLTVITTPLPNLSSIHNPVPPVGGADPDSPAKIRTLAPASVLTFGRAVSADDYEVIAAQTPGVARARAYWSFDPASQCGLVTIYVGDTPDAVTAAKKTLAGAADPNRPVLVLQAIPITARIIFSLRVDPRFQPAPVIAGVQAALLDPDTGLFGLNRVRIGQFVFRSQIYDACLRVPGVLAVHNLHFVSFSRGRSATPIFGSRFFPGEGGFFRLPPDNLTITTEGGAGA
jgi:predicted phage baseplate assembly protein